MRVFNGTETIEKSGINYSFCIHVDISEWNKNKIDLRMVNKVVHMMT